MSKPKTIVTIDDALEQKEAIDRFYELQEKGRRDFDSAMITAREEGFQEGLRESGEEWNIKGRKEVARSLLVKGYSLKQISEWTSLTIEEIKALS